MRQNGMEGMYLSVVLYNLQSQISNQLEAIKISCSMDQKPEINTQLEVSLHQFHQYQMHSHSTDTFQQCSQDIERGTMTNQYFKSQINDSKFIGTQVVDEQSNIPSDLDMECPPSHQQSINNFQIYQSTLHGDKFSMNSNKFLEQDLINCLQSLENALRKIFYRKFQNRLITFYIQSLKDEQRKIRETNQFEIKLLKEQNWPFKELFYKKYKNPNEEILFEFVNMCAQKIQATFKTYITAKRHKQALKKLHNFKHKLTAVLVGWKTWNIFNCKKIQEVKNKFTSISHQIDLQIQNPNTDRFKKMKKIQYLNSSQQVFKQSFIKSFDNLYSSGAWIYEVDKCFKKPFQKNFNKKHPFAQNQYRNEVPEDQNNYSQKSQITMKEKQNSKKGRQRQFKASGGRNLKKQAATLKQDGDSQQISMQKVQNKSQSSTNYQSFELEQRPIVAKGQYLLNQDDMKNNQNEFLPTKQSSKTAKRQEQAKEQTSSPSVNKFKDGQKKKLVKRQMYDPRKAIEQEKKRIEEEKRKMQEKQKEINENPPQEPEPIPKKIQKKDSQISKKTPRKIKKQEPKRELQSPKQSSKQKTVQKIKKQSKLNKKGDNSKSLKSIVIQKKVESKVDCWGPKRESVIEKNPSNEDISYKSKYLMGLKQKNEPKVAQNRSYINNNRSVYQVDQSIEERNISINKYLQSQEAQQSRIGKLIQKQKGKQQYESQETYQSSYLKKLVQEREKGSFTNSNGRLKSQKKIVQKLVSRKQESFSQKFQQLNNNIKRLSEIKSPYANLTNIIKQAQHISSQKQEAPVQKKRQQAYRPIESLEQVYSSQYTDRLNNLKNKLNMLESTRYIQRDESIPVLLQDSKFMRKMYKDNTFSSLYWPQVRTMETTFLDYIKFSGF